MRCKHCQGIMVKRLSENYHRLKSKYAKDIDRSRGCEEMAEYSHQHHVSWASLESSASNGCDFCYFLYQSLCRKYPDLPQRIREGASNRIFIALGCNDKDDLGLWCTQLYIFLDDANGITLDQEPNYHVEINLFISRGKYLSVSKYILDLITIK